MTDSSASPTSRRDGEQHAESSQPQPATTDFGANEWLVDELYQRYLENPGAVDKSWWRFFADYRPVRPSTATRSSDELIDYARDLKARDAPDNIRPIVDKDALAAVEEAIQLSPSRADARELREQLVQDLANSSEAPLSEEKSPDSETVSGNGEARRVEQSLAGGYNADDVNDPNSKDALGFDYDVKLLCSVLAAKATRPPLSIGLFGEWGSGKSFFMRLMRSRIQELAAAAYRAEGGGLQTQYCSHVVQINFNAWHYMDANLWASLAVEIFDRLSTPISPDARPDDIRAEQVRVEEERAQILQQLDTYQQLAAELGEARSRAEQERTRLEGKLAEAAQRRDTVARKLAVVVAEEVVGELDRDPDLTALRVKAAHTLGMTELPAPELPELVDDLRKLSGQAAALWRLLSKRRGTWAFGLIALSAVTLLIGLVLLANPNRLVPAAAAITVAIGAISGFAGKLGPTLNAINNGLDTAEAALRRAEIIKQRFDEKKTKEQIEIETKLKSLLLQEQGLRVQLAEAGAREAAARAEEEELRTGRRLHRFLLERAGSDDYRSELGIISLLHRDLQKLSTLLQLPDNDCDQKPDALPLPRIDRIILYIDDLDRCPPERVIEVLQAIYLLLALPLFIVVVGVDPRWLLRSVQHHYRDLLKASDGEGTAYAEAAHWSATPHDYLEKIFQIPFALMPMTNIGFAAFVSDLAAGIGQSHSEPDSGIQNSNPVETIPEDQEGLLSSTPTPTQVTFRPSSGEDIDPNPTGLSVTSEEIRFIQALQPLIPTPRAGKRLINIYRMIRSAQVIGDKSTFLDSAADQSDGSYRALLQLLALISGFPDLAAEVFNRLMDADPEKSWSVFVDELSQDQEWGRLQAALQNVRNSVGVPDDLHPYREWVPRAARFSFATGRKFQDLSG